MLKSTVFTQPFSFRKVSVEDSKKLSPPKQGFAWGTYVLFGPSWEGPRKGAEHWNENHANITGAGERGKHDIPRRLASLVPLAFSC